MSAVQNSNTKNIDLTVSKAAQSPEMPSYLTGRHTPVSSFKSTNIEGKQYGKKIINPGNNKFSFETPTQFSNKHSDFDQKTYKNPYIFGHKKEEENYCSKNYEKKKAFSFKAAQTFHIFDQHDHNNDKENSEIFNMQKSRKHKVFNHITQEEKEYNPPDLLGSEKQKFHNAYEKHHEEFGHFHKNKELFADFVERNDNLNVYGHLMKTKRQATFRNVKDHTLSEQQHRKKVEALKSTGFISRMMKKFQNNGSKNGSSEPQSSYYSAFPSKVQSEPLLKGQPSPRSMNSNKPCSQSLYSFKFKNVSENGEKKQLLSSDLTFNKSPTQSSNNKSSYQRKQNQRCQTTLTEPNQHSQHELDKYYNKDQAFKNKKTNEIIKQQVNQMIKDKNSFTKREYSSVYENKQRKLEKKSSKPINQISLITMCQNLVEIPEKNPNQNSVNDQNNQINGFQKENQRIKTEENKGHIYIAQSYKQELQQKMR